MSRFIKFLAWTIVALAALAVTVGGSVYLANRISDKKTAVQVCPTTHAVNRKVRIKNGVVEPAHTSARRCDKLTITNLDGTNRLIAFGVHDSHQPYDGVEERLLAEGQSLTVTLDKTGSFRFHDHLHDATQGTFTVR